MFYCNCTFQFSIRGIKQPPRAPGGGKLPEVTRDEETGSGTEYPVLRQSTEGPTSPPHSLPAHPVRGHHQLDFEANLLNESAPFQAGDGRARYPSFLTNMPDFCSCLDDSHTVVQLIPNVYFCPRVRGQGEAISFRILIKSCLCVYWEHVSKKIMSKKYLKKSISHPSHGPHYLPSLPFPCLILFDPIRLEPSGSSVHGTLQATILEWDAIAFSRGFS
ncbi:unnamed protein product [Rangifer tarandus platyrhynchus]|uniref:Uncharacterized protein n=1 Tax=Rangifer tarandus platyrhynchus TaxID=3082113 RepID=A0ABN8ZYW8_RANTA|nr:unnamed protein product [Rangifer tarandus platyrhynchus]